MILNVNTIVTVRLTAAGARLWGCHDVDRLQATEGSQIRCPIWRLMEVFGPSTYIGMEPHFVGNEILPDVRDEARDLLRQVAVALGCPDQAPGDLPSSVEALRLQRDRLEKTCAMPGDRLLADALEARNQAIRERDQARLDAQTQASPVVMRCEVDGHVIEVQARTVAEATEAAQAIGMIAMPAPDAPQKRDEASAKGSLVGRYFDRAVRAELACASLEAERDEARERAAALEAAVERVRPVVKALAVAYGTEAGCPEYRRNWLTHLMNALGRRFTTYADDAAWLRSLLPTTQDDR